MKDAAKAALKSGLHLQRTEVEAFDLSPGQTDAQEHWTSRGKLEACELRHEALGSVDSLL